MPWGHGGAGWHGGWHGGWGPHPVYWGGPGWGWGWGWGGWGAAPLMEGMVLGAVGTSLATSAASSGSAAQTAAAEQAAERASLEAERARLEAQNAASNANAAAAAAYAQSSVPSAPVAAPSGRIVSMVVPTGLPSSGGMVRIRIPNAGEFQVWVPAGAVPGQTIRVRIPDPDEAPIHAAVMHDDARDVYYGPDGSMLMPGPPPPYYPPRASSSSAPSYQQASGAKRWVSVSKDHVVDEDAPQYAAHDIITVRMGDTLELLEGTPEQGCLPPYSDYVLVRSKQNKVGRVSRFCVEDVAQPPALHAP